VLLAFFAGFRSRKSVILSDAPVRKERRQLLGSKDPGPVTIGNLALREDTLRTDQLSGRLVIRNTPQNGILFVDSRPVDPDNAATGGYDFHWGEHTVAVRDSTGRMLCRHNISLLPFQIKTVDLSIKLAKGGDN
jgi:hypothetical protein